MVIYPLNYSFITTVVSRYNHYIVYIYTTIYASLAAMRTIITYNYVNWYLFTVLLWVSSSSSSSSSSISIRQAVDTAPCEGVLNFDISIFFVCTMF